MRITSLLSPLLLTSQAPRPSSAAPVTRRDAPTTSAPWGALGVAVRPMTLNDAVDADGFHVRTYGWNDASNEVRQAALVPNGLADPKGFFGGYLRRLDYGNRSCTSPSDDWPGIGFAVNHYMANGSFPSDSSRFHPGNAVTFFMGRHHAIHAYQWEYNLGNAPLKVTNHWLFTNTRDNFVWAVTYDVSQAAADSLTADYRGPYGVINFDGTANAPVAGIGWGDRAKFTAGNGTFDLNSPWDYSKPGTNTVPYVYMYTQNPPAGFGWTQTETFDQHPMGGYQGYHDWGKAGPAGPMPPATAWPYQLSQYDDNITYSKHLAVGAPYGAVGQREYLRYGNDKKVVGWPYQSYSLWGGINNRTHDDVVAQQVAEVEATQKASLKPHHGVQHVSAMPAGLARPDARATKPKGYNPIYATWELVARPRASVLAWELKAKSTQPMQVTFVVHNWTTPNPPAFVTRNGVRLAADSTAGYLASVDAERQNLWLTLAESVHKGAGARLQVGVP